jgi:hypothetical protein
MTNFDVWALEASQGICKHCETAGLVQTYGTFDLCFLCSSQPFPPSRNTQLVLHAISTAFYEIRKPKKPRRSPRNIVAPMVRLTQMTPVRKR